MINITYYYFHGSSCCSDTSNVSVGDLENIQETDTPPQSPTDSQPSVGDTVIINMGSGGAGSVSYRRKAGSDKSEKTDETDLESPTTTTNVRDKSFYKLNEKDS